MRRWRLAALAFAAAWWWIDLGVLGAGVPAPLDDSWEYGVVARHLLAGDGFRTGVIHPPLWGLHDAAFTVPVLVHGPLIPLMLAPLIAAFGPGALDAMAWLAAAFAFATAVLLDRVVARRGGDLAAATCVTLFTLSPLTLAAVHHDASMVIGACFLLASIAALDMPRPRAVAAGLLVSIGALARPELAGAGVVLGVFAPGGTRWPFFAALVATRLAWLAYRGATTGMPAFDLSSYLLLADTSGYPELSALRRFDLTPEHFGATLRDALPMLPAKWAHALPRAIKHALTAPNVAAGWLAALAVGMTAWRGLRRASNEAPRAGGAGAPTSAVASPAPILGPLASQPAALPLQLRDVVLMTIPIALLVVTERRATLLVPFLPLWTWTAWHGASLLWRRGAAPLFAVLALVAAPIGIMSLTHELAESRQAAAWLSRERVALEGAVAAWDTGRSLRTIVPPHPVRTVVVLSDTPDFVTWTTRRPAVWMTPEELLHLESEPGAWPRDLPRRDAGSSTWFHDDPRRYR